MSTGNSDEAVRQKKQQVASHARKQATSAENKIAIVCDWLIGGGAEKVVLELHRMFPDAPVFTSYCTDEWRERLDDKVVTGYLQKWPFSKIRKFIPFLRLFWFSNLKLNDYDLVISSSGAEAKYIKAPKHICYLHAPTHYYWEKYDEYMKNPGFGKLDWLARLGLKLFVKPLRKIDYKKAQDLDIVVANSEYDKSQIKKYYGIDAEVIHPPVELDRFNKNPTNSKRKGFVVVGRQTPYKRFDLAVQACTKLGLELKVLGNGPENSKLKELAGPKVEFIDNPSDTQIVDALYSSVGFLFPGVDDFGIVAIEAMASGTPVIAYKAGGALDYVIPNKTGEFFEMQTIKSLVEVLSQFNSQNYDHSIVARSAEQFSPQNFRDKMNTLIKGSY